MSAIVKQIREGYVEKNKTREQPALGGSKKKTFFL